MKKVMLLVFISTFIAGCKITIPESYYLKCTATVSQSEVISGESLEISVNASGGSSPYYIQGSISSFNPSTIVTRTYENSGTNDEFISDTVIVNDSIGLTTQCGFSVIVKPKDPVAPSLNLSAYPSTSVAVGSVIIVVAHANGFETNPNFIFTIEEPGVEMRSYDFFATFISSDNQAHSFPVTVTASDSSSTVQSSINLSFTENYPLSCTITRNQVPPTSRGYRFKFKVSASSGEELIITEAITADKIWDWPIVGDTIPRPSSPYADTVFFNYYSCGTKEVYIKAKSRTQNVFCNNGEYMINTFTIGCIIPPPPPTFSCTAYVDNLDYRVWYGDFWPNFDGFLYNSVVTWASVIGGTGGEEIVSLRISGYPRSHYNTYPGNPLAKEVFFHDPGSYTITLTIKDNSGQSATCTTPFFRVWP